MMEQHSASATTSSSSSQRGGGRELQGPRPTPLRVHKDSHKIRKPPTAGPAPAQVRQPVIIYTVSPKIVHANPSEFMSVVQRLTGPSIPPPPPPSSLPFPFFPHPSTSSYALPQAPQQQLPFPFHQQAAGPHDGAQLLSPAARLAAIEQASVTVARSGPGGLPPLPSILSPAPGSSPAIPAGFFSPAVGGAGGGINLFGELVSPAFRGHNTLFGHHTTAAAGATPPQMLHLPAAPSPSPSGAYYWDLFNNHPNL